MLGFSSVTLIEIGNESSGADLGLHMRYRAPLLTKEPFYRCLIYNPNHVKSLCSKVKNMLKVAFCRVITWSLAPS